MKKRKGLYERYYKRLIDLVLSLLAIIILSPILLIIAIVIRVKLGSPILFKQKRPGKNKKIFTMYKFRTMKNEFDNNGNMLPDEYRITKLGTFLRMMSLDELPELYNIVKGDMSIIGPRPLLVEYLPLYTDYQNRRHEVRPGLSGLAQINGRNAISWEDKFEMDVQYVNNVTFSGDCRIILMTLVKVFKHEGISSKDSVTIKPFEGTK